MVISLSGEEKDEMEINGAHLLSPVYPVTVILNPGVTVRCTNWLLMEPMQLLNDLLRTPL